MKFILESDSARFEVGLDVNEAPDAATFAAFVDEVKALARERLRPPCPPYRGPRFELTPSPTSPRRYSDGNYVVQGEPRRDLTPASLEHSFTTTVIGRSP